MSGRKRKVAAIGAAVFLATGSAALALPGTAYADTINTKCGSSVTANVGDTVVADVSVLSALLGSVNLGTVTSSTTSLSKLVGGLLCKVTVNVLEPVSDVVDIVEEATKPVTDPVKDAVGGLLPGGEQPPEQSPPKDGGTGGDQNGGPDDKKGTGGDQNGSNMPDLKSPPVSTLPGWNYNFGRAPMRDYSAIPYYNAGLFSPSPGLRYGSGIPGYSPDFGILGDSGEGSNQVQNAGSASSLASASGGSLGDVGLPGLLAVLALAGASAGLVRTWVLRRALTN